LGKTAYTQATEVWSLLHLFSGACRKRSAKMYAVLLLCWRMDIHTFEKLLPYVQPLIQRWSTKFG